MQVVVQHRGQQVVRRGDGVKVAGEMQIDLVHRVRPGHSRRRPRHPSRRTRVRAKAPGCRPRPSCRAGAAPGATPTVTVDLPSPAGVGIDAGHEDEPALRLRAWRWRRRRSWPCTGRKAGTRPAPGPARPQPRRWDGVSRPGRWRCRMGTVGCSRGHGGSSAGLRRQTAAPKTRTRVRRLVDRNQTFRRSPRGQPPARGAIRSATCARMPARCACPGEARAPDTGASVSTSSRSSGVSRMAWSRVQLLNVTIPLKDT